MQIDSYLSKIDRIELRRCSVVVAIAAIATIAAITATIASAIATIAVTVAFAIAAIAAIASVVVPWSGINDFWCSSVMSSIVVRSVMISLVLDDNDLGSSVPTATR